MNHPAWSESFSWLIQGTTLRGAGFDLGLFGTAPTGAVQDRWARLLGATGFEAAVHGRQVHGAEIVHHHTVAPGLRVAGSCDGHMTAEEGMLLTVSIADCVPVSVIDSSHPAIALLHAGWRGVAAGILERGLTKLTKAHSSGPNDLHVHFGPSICGTCYEVGPEVHVALGLAEPEHHQPIDLRRELAHRAVAQGVPPHQISISTLCTRCSGTALFSHRGGDAGRQISFLGIRPDLE